MRTDRKKDLDKYYNEIKGIQSAVYEALDREDKAEQLEKEAYEAWKKSNE